MSNYKILHKKSISNMPQPSNLEYGELAVRYGGNQETIFLKNDKDEIVSIDALPKLSKNYQAIDYPQTEQGDFKALTSGDTIESAITTVEENIVTFINKVSDLTGFEGLSYQQNNDETITYINKAISLSDADNLLDKAISNLNKNINIENKKVYYWKWDGSITYDETKKDTLNLNAFDNIKEADIVIIKNNSEENGLATYHTSFVTKKVANLANYILSYYEIRSEEDTMSNTQMKIFEYEFEISNGYYKANNKGSENLAFISDLENFVYRDEFEDEITNFVSKDNITNGSGLTVNSNGNISVNIGKGLEFNEDGAIVVTAQTSNGENVDFSKLNEALSEFSANTETQIDGINERIDTLVSGNTTDVIDTFNEITNFLSGVTNQETFLDKVNDISAYIDETKEELNVAIYNSKNVYVIKWSGYNQPILANLNEVERAEVVIVYNTITSRYSIVKNKAFEFSNETITSCTLSFNEFDNENVKNIEYAITFYNDSTRPIVVKTSENKFITEIKVNSTGVTASGNGIADISNLIPQIGDNNGSSNITDLSLYVGNGLNYDNENDKIVVKNGFGVTLDENGVNVDANIFALKEDLNSLSYVKKVKINDAEQSVDENGVAALTININGSKGSVSTEDPSVLGFYNITQSIKIDNDSDPIGCSIDGTLHLNGVLATSARVEELEGNLYEVEENLSDQIVNCITKNDIAKGSGLTIENGDVSVKLGEGLAFDGDGAIEITSEGITDLSDYYTKTESDSRYPSSIKVNGTTFSSITNGTIDLGTITSNESVDLSSVYLWDTNDNGFLEDGVYDKMLEANIIVVKYDNKYYIAESLEKGHDQFLIRFNVKIINETNDSIVIKEYYINSTSYTFDISEEKIYLPQSVYDLNDTEFLLQEASIINGSGLTVNSNGYVSVKLGEGLTFDANSGITINKEFGSNINGNCITEIKVNGTGVTASSDGVADITNLIPQFGDGNGSSNAASKDELISVQNELNNKINTMISVEGTILKIKF